MSRSRKIMSLLLVLSILTSCSYHYYSFDDFRAYPERVYPIVVRSLLIEPFRIARLGGPHDGRADYREVADFITQACARYLEASGLFSAVIIADNSRVNYRTEYRLEGTIESLMIESLVDGVWIVIAVAGALAASVGMFACGIEWLQYIASLGCSNLSFPSWAWWSIGLGSLASAGGLIGLTATSRLRCEATLSLSLTSGELTLVSGTYQSISDDRANATPSMALQAAVNPLLDAFALEVADALRLLDENKQVKPSDAGVDY